jgi:ABC-2 type transport system ATP-binding protein
MSAPAVEVRGLHKSYGRVEAVDGLDFTVRPGRCYGLFGRNGAGKTTTMRIVLGVLGADKGEVRWDGAPLDLETRRQFGYMPEERGLYPKMRVREQLAYLGELHGMSGRAPAVAAGRWLERFDLAERADDELQALSLGNQQRVQLAAALVFDPVVLVLDEPFAGLDPVAVDVMSAVLRERANAGVAVVFSSHELDLVERICDRVGIIDQHHMVACGTVDELRRSGPERLWIDAPAAPDDWADSLKGATVVRRDGTRLLLELAPKTDGQAILRAGLRTGPVREFRRAEPSLVELFRDAIKEEQP